MNIRRTKKNTIFIMFFIVVAISFFSQADILVPKDVAAAEKQSCVTTECHANMGEGNYVHGPVSVGECTFCHQPTAKHGFKPITNEGKVCDECHDKQFTVKSIHPPVKEWGCTGCHDPHQSPYKLMLRRGLQTKSSLL
jgi:predicted CXXCH cytochrome family protein